jgi:hypothetical protein
MPRKSYIEQNTKKTSQYFDSNSPFPESEVEEAPGDAEPDPAPSRDMSSSHADNRAGEEGLIQSGERVLPRSATDASMQPCRIRLFSANRRNPRKDHPRHSVLGALPGLWRCLVRSQVQHSCASTLDVPLLRSRHNIFSIPTPIFIVLLVHTIAMSGAALEQSVVKDSKERMRCFATHLCMIRQDMYARFVRI